MTALLTADEAARLTLGVNVIVRSGDRQGCPTCVNLADHWFVAPERWVALTGPCPTCEGSGCDIDFCRDCGDEYSDPCERHVEHDHNVSDDKCCPDCRDGRRIVPLYRAPASGERPINADHPDTPSPFYGSQCHLCETDGHLHVWNCPNNPLRPVGWGSIEVVPVVDFGEWEITARPIPAITVDDYDQSVLMVEGEGSDGAYGEGLTLDPLPVPGHDFGIVIDVTELA